MKQPSWKEIAACPGYKTIKAKYIRDVQRAANEKAQGRHPMRDKPELLKRFNWIISRAKHYAHHKDVSIIEILNQWAVKYDYNWLNAFQDCLQPRLDKKYKKYPVSLRGKIRAVKRNSWRRPGDVSSVILRHQTSESKKTPSRYTIEDKKRYHERRKFRERKQSL